MPARGIEDQFDIGAGDGRHQFQLGANIVGEELAHATTRGGQRHLDLDPALPLVVVQEVALVNQAQVDNVDRDLRVEAGAQLVPEHFLDILVGVIGRKFRQRRDYQDNGIGIGAGNAEQVAFDIDGETAAQGLGDVPHLAGGQDDFSPRAPGPPDSPCQGDRFAAVAVRCHAPES